MRRRAGFTLIEMLVVIVIIAILSALVAVAVSRIMDGVRRDATEATIRTIGAACRAYFTASGDYPPSDLQEIGGTGLNDLNNGIEALTACLASERGGGPKHYEGEKIDNLDDDSAGSNITRWRYGDLQLREIVDAWGYPLIYFHHRDYEGKNPRVLKYRLSRDAAPVQVRPARNTKTNTYVGPGAFQLWSVGKDGIPGTADDIVVDP
jgi:prepilin-type N-terminal cleavage/methylation domain-containing protein